MISPARGLPIGVDAVLPIAIWLVVGLVFVAALVLVVTARRRLSAREPSEVPESDTGPQPSVDTVPGRDRNLPRWLDPAVAAARFTTDGTTTARPAAAAAVAPARVPMVFVTPGDELAERHRVRYDGVPLLDRPDDLLGQMLRELDVGDEVELLERAEIWAQVRTPNNLIGWIPGMTLSAESAAVVENGPISSDVIELDLEAAADEPPPLEAILAAIAAQRLARHEPQPLDETAPTSPRPRARKPKGEQLTPPTRRARPRSKATRGGT